MKTPVTGAVIRREHRGLALEAEDGPMHHGSPEMERGIVDEVPGREVVTAVDDHLVALQDRQRVL